MNILERIAEERIRQAMEAGAFEHLPGKGAPLNLEDNPFEAEEWRAAFHLLRAQGFSLPWIEERRAIEEAIADARRDLQQARQLDDPQAWSAARARYAARVAAINRRIREYNLSVPAPRFQRPLVSLNDCE